MISVRSTLSFLLLAASLLFAAHAAAEPPLTEERILEVVRQIEAASVSRDLPGLVRHLAPEAVVRIEMSPEAGGQVMELDRDQYAKVLSQGWAASSTIRYEVRDVRTKIAADGRSAEATSTVLETMRVQGQTLRSRTRERARFVSRGGRVLVTHVSGLVEVSAPASAAP